MALNYFVFALAFQSVTSFRHMVSFKYQNYAKVIQCRWFFSREKLGTKPLEMSLTNERHIETCAALFDSMLRDKVPAYKKKDDDFLIINTPNETLGHPVLGAEIDTYVSAVLSSKPNADRHSKPLFAVVAGAGKGKTRMLVEMQRKFNEKPNVFSLALTYRLGWWHIMALPDRGRFIKNPIEYRCAVSIVARIISMNYHILLYDVELLLEPFLRKIDTYSISPSDLIHECVKYIVRQYRAGGKTIDQFVLLVDESHGIQRLYDPDGKLDVHQALRESLLTQPMIMDDGLPLKVDLVMSG
jgi:hypothetical protein